MGISSEKGVRKVVDILKLRTNKSKKAAIAAFFDYQ